MAEMTPKVVLNKQGYTFDWFFSPKENYLGKR